MHQVISALLCRRKESVVYEPLSFSRSPPPHLILRPPRSPLDEGVIGSQNIFLLSSHLISAPLPAHVLLLPIGYSDSKPRREGRNRVGKPILLYRVVAIPTSRLEEVVAIIESASSPPTCPYVRLLEIFIPHSPVGVPTICPGGCESIN